MLILNNNNLCYWMEKKHSTSNVFLLFAMLFSMMMAEAAAVIPVEKNGQEDQSEIIVMKPKVNVAAIPMEQSEREHQSGTKGEHASSADFLAAIANVDRTVLLVKFLNLPTKDSLVTAKIIADKLNSLLNYEVSPHALKIAEGVLRYEESKTVISWVNFWPYLLHMSDVHKRVAEDGGSDAELSERNFLPIVIRHLAVRPAFHQHPTSDQQSLNHSGRIDLSERLDGHVLTQHDNDLVNMVEMLKEMQKVDRNTAEKQNVLEKKSTSPGNGEWKNREVCMQMVNLVEMLKREDSLKSEKKPEYDSGKHKKLTALLTNIYNNHKDVLAGKRDEFSKDVKEQMDELLTSGGMAKMLVDDKLQKKEEKSPLSKLHVGRPEPSAKSEH